MDRQNFFAALFRHRGAVPLLLGVPIVITALRADPLDGASALLGGAVTAAGLALRLFTVRQIGRGARVFRAHASAGLIAAGPYRWSRNPLYLAAALMLCGLGLVAGAGWLAVALFPAALLAYTPVVIAEEHSLADLLGDDYRRYRDCVPRWLGLPRRRPSAERAQPVAGSEVFRREKPLVLRMIAGAVAIVAVCSQWIPSRFLTEQLELAVGADLDLAWIVAAAVPLVLSARAVKVEVHHRLRSANRSAREHAAASH
jgi:protein-S-isoprenylcysteine O-methyltransferase Ste14